LLGYLKRKCSLANLPGPQKDNSRLGIEGRYHDLTGLALVHTLQLLHEVEVLQGYYAQSSKPSRSARSSNIFTDDGCQLVRPRGVRSRMDSSLLQIA
jgi:hypothetical protein